MPHLNNEFKLTKVFGINLCYELTSVSKVIVGSVVLYRSRVSAKLKRKENSPMWYKWRAARRNERQSVVPFTPLTATRNAVGSSRVEISRLRFFGRVRNDQLPKKFLDDVLNMGLKPQKCNNPNRWIDYSMISGKSRLGIYFILDSFTTSEAACDRLHAAFDLHSRTS